MHRENKVKDARRRARLAERRTAAASTTTRLIPDKRRKLIEKAKRKDGLYE